MNFGIFKDFQKKFHFFIFKMVGLLILKMPLILFIWTD